MSPGFPRLITVADHQFDLYRNHLAMNFSVHIRDYRSAEISNVNRCFQRSFLQRVLWEIHGSTTKRNIAREIIDDFSVSERSE